MASPAETEAQASLVARETPVCLDFLASLADLETTVSPAPPVWTVCPEPRESQVCQVCLDRTVCLAATHRA